jgi:chaperone BCS1
MLTFSRARFEELLTVAKKAFRKEEEGEIIIKMIDEDKDSGEWRQVAKKAKRSLNSVVTEAGVKERLERNILEFCQSQDWYLSRGVPWRLGVLLHGKSCSYDFHIIGELIVDVVTLIRQVFPDQVKLL